MTSVEQLASESGTSSAAWSGSHESFGSFSSFGSGLNGKRDRRRRRRGAPALLQKQATDKTKRAFQCTFCTDTFKSKYDWSRHEKSLHLSLEKFICCPLGPEITDSITGEKVCAYCLIPDTTPEHLETHGHQPCVEKGLEARTFYRKDHLRQHLRLMHGSQLLPHMDLWKVEAKFINSRCGFCQERFTAWQDRVDHIAAHFKDGRKMLEWKGCRGLDPNVAASVLNAMSPYLIGVEQTSPVPFSATSSKRCMTVNNHIQNGGAPTTCWEILTVRLGRFAKEQSDKGVLLTDELLQNQARLILYDDPDPWNQTAADNAEWLDLFKRAHGLDYIPNAVGGAGKNVPEDLELYGDLGVRIPFSVQLKQGVTEDVPSQTAALVADAQRQRSVSQKSTSIADDGAPHRRIRYSALAIPREKAKLFETVTAPYPASGVRGAVLSTKDMGEGTDYDEANVLCALGMTGSSLLDASASTSRTNSSAEIQSLQQHESQTSPSICDPAFMDKDCMMSNLGMGSGKLEDQSDFNSIFPGAAIQQQQGWSTAQQELDAMNACLAAATTAAQPADAPQCCETGHCSHQDQILSHLGFHPSSLNLGCSSGPALNFSAPTATGTITTGGGSSATLATTEPTAFSTPLEMADISMDDFDFNDMSFNDVSFPDVDLSQFDAQMAQFDAVGFS